MTCPSSLSYLLGSHNVSFACDASMVTVVCVPNIVDQGRDAVCVKVATVYCRTLWLAHEQTQSLEKDTGYVFLKFAHVW